MSGEHHPTLVDAPVTVVPVMASEEAGCDFTVVTTPGSELSDGVVFALEPHDAAEEAMAIVMIADATNCFFMVGSFDGGDQPLPGPQPRKTCLLKVSEVVRHLHHWSGSE